MGMKQKNTKRIKTSKESNQNGICLSIFGKKRKEMCGWSCQLWDKLMCIVLI